MVYSYQGCLLTRVSPAATSDDGATTCTGATREPGLEGAGGIWCIRRWGCCGKPNQATIWGCFFPPTWQYWGRFIFGFTRYFAGIQMEYDDAMGFLSIHHGLSRYECAICTHQALLSTFKTFVSYWILNELSKNLSKVCWLIISNVSITPSGRARGRNMTRGIQPPMQRHGKPSEVFPGGRFLHVPTHWTGEASCRSKEFWSFHFLFLCVAQTQIPENIYLVYYIHCTAVYYTH